LRIAEGDDYHHFQVSRTAKVLKNSDFSNSTNPATFEYALCLLHNLSRIYGNSPKIVHEKQKINETLLVRGINFALCKDAKISFLKSKDLR
jgi:hypothetical protein